MGDLASRVAALSDEKRAWLARRVAALRSAPPGPKPLPRRAGVNVFRTSFAQERVWVLEQLAAGSAVYNVGGVYRAIGRLDVDALARALDALVTRHESLRTTFVATEGVPRQVVSSNGAVSLTITDLPPDGDAESAVALAVGETRRPFDVARGPLLRVAVFGLGEEMHLVAVTMHHLVADAWSLEIFVRDLAIAYRACAAGRQPEWAAPRLQYVDYAEWQRAQLAQPERHRELTAYWRDQLRELAYPDVPCGNRLSFRGEAVSRELPADLVRTLHAFVRREGVTVFVVLLAAWLLTLARRVGRSDVTVVTPIANRDRPEVSEVIGFFVNLVALRVTWPSDMSFRSLVHRVKDVVRGAQVHQDLPFEMLLDELGVERSLARPPLTPFAFALERAIVGTVALPGVEIQAVEIDGRTSKTDLALIVRDHDHGLTVRLERNADLYAASTAEGLLAGLSARLVRGLEAPDAILRETFPENADAAQVAATDSIDGTVWHRFAAQAAWTPAAPAVRATATTLSYAQLAARAAWVADRLAAAGVRRGSIVAVWAERGVEWVATMLGLWRLGAVYLPVDPRWPLARITQVVERSGARVMAVRSTVPPAAAAAAAKSAWTLVAIDEEPIASDAPGDVGASTTASGLAYVLYTSGSTGVPKGALIDHAALLNHLDAKCALLGLGPADHVAQTAAASFDIAIWQAVAPLLVGGVVEILPDEVARDPVRLVEASESRGVTVLQVVPAMLRAVLHAESDGTPECRSHALDHLRWIVVTGEELPPAVCRAWLERHPHVPLVNAYGPTECGDDVAHHVIAIPPEPDAVRVPIGRPIAGAVLRVLDRALRPVEAGAAGELCVSGVPVGRGYLDDPERTAAAFVSPDPFDGRPGTRLYRTGDRGRMRSDGLFEYLGRLDAQVKIRGQRVEPEEVEAVLRTHPGVHEAAVVARDGGRGEQSLAAYVVADAPLEQVRRYVAERLPEAMVPALIVPVATMPRDANGKLDRRSLREGPPTPVACSERRMSVRERRLADIWQVVLGVDPRSAADDFFALGGDSLMTLRVVALARREGLVLTPQQVFEQRTIEALARVIVAANGHEAEQGLVTGAVALTPVQRMFLEARLPEAHHYNLSVLLEVLEPPALPLLAVALEHVLRHHDALRLRVEAAEGGGWRQTIADLEGEVPCSRVDLSAVGDDELASSIEAEASALQATLDLAAGPLVRVAWFDLGPRRSSRLLVVVHHLACDVVSMPILLEDLAAVYDQLRRGLPVALPTKTASFRAWARALDDYGRAPERLDELAWWRAECADVGARLVPERAADEAAVAHLAHLRIDVGAAETEAILRYAGRRRVTLESILATGLVTTVTEHVGGDALLVYLERHGRGTALDHLDVSRTVGWFTAPFPVRLAVAASRRPAATLEAIHDHARAIPHGGLGYAALWCRDDEAALTLRALPRPQVSLNYLGRSDPPEEVPWRLAPESGGREHGRGGRRPTVLDLNAFVERGRLVLDWAYDAVHLRRATIAHIAARALGVMRQLVEEADDA